MDKPPSRDDPARWRQVAIHFAAAIIYERNRNLQRARIIGEAWADDAYDHPYAMEEFEEAVEPLLAEEQD